MKSARGGNVEALARRERYRFFAEVVERRRLDKVATAHTRDDQVETVLMWFLRGAGVRGLGGMAPRQELNIAGNGSTQKLIVVRPLLRTSKAEVLRFLQQHELAFRIDQTNLDRAFLRNWIRLDLLPTIERRIGSGLKTRLSQQAKLCRDENDLLDDLARSRYREMARGDRLARPALLREPPALQRRILRMWIEQARGDLRGLDFVHIDAMLRLIIDGPPQGRLSIPGGWELVREYDVLKLAKTFRGSARVCYNYPLEIGKVLVVPEARLELWSRRVSGISRLLEDDLMGAVFDAASVTELSVRNFRPGDRFQPLGMAGHKKVKDLFIEKRVPRSMRACWPLVTSGGEVLWIPRYGRSSVGLVSEKTTSVLHLKARSIPAWPGALKC
jgi:tRNA(Ile)-lysidine synthase